MKYQSNWSILVAVIFFLSIPSLAYAHIEDDAAGFMSGLTHPIFGLDHFLAMFGVGVVSAQLGGNKIYVIPLIFVVMMVAGGILGASNIAVSMMEIGIALSVFTLGVSIFFAGRKSGIGSVIMCATAVFGSLHGNAHGLEMPEAVSPVFYAAGFVFSTSCIHLLGVGVGHLLTLGDKAINILRGLGAGMTGAGVIFFVKAIM